MYFVFHATDKADHLNVRMENRTAHLEYNKNAQQHGVSVVMGGPRINSNGDMIGSMMIYKAENRHILEDFLANDPYTLANLFETHTLSEYKVVFKDNACLI